MFRSDPHCNGESPVFLFPSSYTRFAYVTRAGSSVVSQ